MTTIVTQTAVNLSGTNIPLGSYTNPSAHVANDKEITFVALNVTATFDAATALTDMRVKLQGKDDQAPTAQWFDIITTRASDGSPGSGATVAEHVFTASAGNSLSDTLVTTGSYMVPSLRVVVEATGAGPQVAGDKLFVTLRYGEG